MDISTANISEKKRLLLAQKEKLTSDIKNCEREIQIARSHYNRNTQYYNEPDSDSDSSLDEPCVYTNEKKRSELNTLTTSLNATIELTGLIILEKEVNILVEPPQLTQQHRNEDVEPGIWKEVMADCKIERVQFGLSFYLHQPYRKYSAPSYHNLTVDVFKEDQKKELSRSLLHEVTSPSDAFTILHSYAMANTSRRHTLWRLAEKYDQDITMAPLPEGGYMLKCSDLLNMSWQLENQFSYISPFYHRMKFDLEYMDEQYVRSIKQWHKQLNNPSVKTDDRTYYLSKIIDVLQTVKQLNHSQDGGESDVNSHTNNSRTTLDNEQIDVNELEPAPKRNKDKDSEVMAPPKYLPKKAKIHSVAQKRSNNDEVLNEVAKKKAKSGSVTEKHDQEKVVDANTVGKKKEVKSKEQNEAKTKHKNAVSNNKTGSVLTEKNDKEKVIDANVVGKKVEVKNKEQNEAKTNDRSAVSNKISRVLTEKNHKEKVTDANRLEKNKEVKNKEKNEAKTKDRNTVINKNNMEKEKVPKQISVLETNKNAVRNKHLDSQKSNKNIIQKQSENRLDKNTETVSRNNDIVRENKNATKQNKNEVGDVHRNKNAQTKKNSTKDRVDDVLVKETQSARNLTEQSKNVNDHPKASNKNHEGTSQTKPLTKTRDKNNIVNKHKTTSNKQDGGNVATHKQNTQKPIASNTEKASNSAKEPQTKQHFKTKVDVRKQDGGPNVIKNQDKNISKTNINTRTDNDLTKNAFGDKNKVNDMKIISKIPQRKPDSYHHFQSQPRKSPRNVKPGFGFRNIFNKK